MKNNYEDRTRLSLPRRTYTIIRLDGKAFHTYTKSLKKPFDNDLSNDLDNAVIKIINQIQGAKFAYIQSDEISILLTDFEKPTTDAWFDGNLQKICSVSASLMTAEFNHLRLIREISTHVRKSGISTNLYYDRFDIQEVTKFTKAYFDSRVFTVPDRTEVMNYFIWRNNDAARNSISMVAQSMFSHGELQGKSSLEMIKMIESKGVRWDTYDQSDKNGRLIIKENYKLPTADVDTMRTKWIITPAWKFTQDMPKLLSMIPTYEN